MRVLVAGGGHGAATSLRAALRYSSDISAIITVADDGGSSGRLARELGVLPMGDIRNCLAALAPDSAAVQAFQHRFADGKFEGHVVGNLMMAATAQQTGDFMQAITSAASMLGSRGRVVPPTLTPVRLISEIDGRKVEGQVALASSNGRVSYVALDPPDAPAYPEALDLLHSAEQIVLGPGSLFTSIIPSLLVPDVRDALASSEAVKVYVMNIASHGETASHDACAHLAALYAHLGESAVDVVVLHNGPRPQTRHPVMPDEAGLVDMGVKVVTADLIPADRSPRHEPAALGKVLSTL